MRKDATEAPNAEARALHDSIRAAEPVGKISCTFTDLKIPVKAQRVRTSITTGMFPCDREITSVLVAWVTHI